MANEVRIKLTAEQKAKIKSATGKVLNEIRVGSLGSNPAVTSATSVSARTARAQMAATRTARVAVQATRTARALTTRTARASDNQG